MESQIQESSYQQDETNEFAQKYFYPPTKDDNHSKSNTEIEILYACLLSLDDHNCELCHFRHHRSPYSTFSFIQISEAWEIIVIDSFQRITIFY